MLVFDHIAVSASSLAEGVDHVEAALGVTLAGGGQHPHMATHNRLLNLGDLYLEVIAADPAQPRPAWPRWFDLDRFSGPPRLTNWVARCDDLNVEIFLSPPGIGIPVSLQRGDFRWKMAVPANGILPFDGAFPALIRWEGTAHPAPRLPDAGVRLVALDITHPDATALTAALQTRISDARLRLHVGPQAMQATFLTPHGIRHL